MLGHAVEAFRAALTVQTEDANRPGWARISYDLGQALHAEADANGDDRLLSEALEAFGAAQQGFDRNVSPMLWADATSAHADVLMRVGLEARDGNRVLEARQALVDALDAYHAIGVTEYDGWFGDRLTLIDKHVRVVK